MPASIRSTIATNRVSTNPEVVAVPVPSGLADGDVYYVACSSRGSYFPGPVTTTGWELIVHELHSSAFNGHARLRVWRTVIDGTPPASHDFQNLDSLDVQKKDFVTHLGVAVQGADTSVLEDVIATTTSIGDGSTAGSNTNTAVTLPQITASDSDGRLLLAFGMFNSNGLNTATFQAVSGLTLDIQGSASTSVSGAVYSAGVATASEVGPWSAGIDQTPVPSPVGRYAAATILVESAGVPDAPTIGTATPGVLAAQVTFTAPTSDGGSPILDYRATSTPGGITATGTSSPITVTGLTAFEDYTFTVAARNVLGYSSESAASNEVAPSEPSGPAPEADAGANQTVEPGELVTLDATGTTSSAGSETYAWTQTAGDSTAILKDAATSTADFHAPQGPDELTFQVLVSDGNGTDTDTVTVEILPFVASLPVRVRAGNEGDSPEWL